LNTFDVTYPVIVCLRNAEFVFGTSPKAFLASGFEICQISTIVALRMHLK